MKKKKKEDVLLSKEGGVVPSGDVGVVGVGVVGVAAMSISGWLCGNSLHTSCHVMSGKELPPTPHPHPLMSHHSRAGGAGDLH